MSVTKLQSAVPAVGTIRLYCAGGGGINLGKKYGGPLPDYIGSAKVMTTYVDTSKTNLHDVPDAENVFVLPELDGSGKVRKENHEAIAQMVPRILKDHPPADFNLVIFTASGGTGSVAGPLILAELLTRGENTVAIVIGSEESVITSTNTFNTLKSLDHIARSKGKPVVMHYSNNARGTKRSDIDKEAMFVISSLSVLASRQNKELDSMDVANWLNFTKTTSVPAQLALLKVYSEADEVDRLAGEAFTMAALLRDEDEEQPQLKPEYSCAGYYREDAKIATSLFFVVETEGLRGVLNHLNGLATAAQEIKAARVEGPAFVSSKDEVSATGLIL